MIILLLLASRLSFGILSGFLSFVAKFSSFLISPMHAT